MNNEIEFLEAIGTDALHMYMLPLETHFDENSTPSVYVYVYVMTINRKYQNLKGIFLTTADNWR